MSVKSPCLASWLHRTPTVPYLVNDAGKPAGALPSPAPDGAASWPFDGAASGAGVLAASGMSDGSAEGAPRIPVGSVVELPHPTASVRARARARAKARAASNEPVVEDDRMAAPLSTDHERSSE